jgi:hypothetical protein
MLTGAAWSDTALLVAMIAVPALALWLVFRKPVEGPVPRDSLSEKGKAEAHGLGIALWPYKAYRENLVDKSDDSAQARGDRDTDGDGIADEDE